MTSLYRLLLTGPAAPARAWDVAGRAAATAVPEPELLPDADGDTLGLLLEPVDLVSLLGAPDPRSHTGDDAEPAPRPALSARSADPFPPATPRPRSVRARDDSGGKRGSSMPPASAATTWGRPGNASGFETRPVPAGPPVVPGRGAGPARVLPTPGQGSAHLAALLQRLEARQGAGAASADATPDPGPWGASASDGRTTGSNAPEGPSARHGSAVVEHPRRAEAIRRLNAGPRPARPPFAGLEGRVAERLTAWSVGRSVAGESLAAPHPGPARGALDSPGDLVPPPSPSPSSSIRVQDRAAPSARGTVLQAVPRSALTGPAAPTEAGGGPAARQVARLVGVVEQAVSELAAVERRLGELEERRREPAAGPVEWLDDEELTDRLQAIFARQARRRGIDLS